ncbi:MULTISPECIES: phosphate-starvation-inducible protein PsiE [Bacillus]|jgi:protein PsiE|uniref:Protein PsiE homolog n=3 Tax=Bacillus amyloliquefaciens group TaxID=1938374 RepID=PSIE_BACVZ|nr:MULTISPECIES: phosphate-starvation-inducible protein PsiE [Bacillus]A7Z6Z1.1 RecName: Full=Protein PsiE homolog [Bacillus velezensis FZB42]AIW38205.1 protein PsiE [Bacillus subtilis]ARM28578.1 phosphate-starvation-inducible protein PsiE [Bacillus vallismortis]SLB12252.1 phosphate-starvation-inducible protein PsiE [Mycobacteroides abscessus subsp. massiliense]ABS74767.1 phosphate-starvation-inducible protein PsiE [Bacillus velezensis FZB42]AGZ57191.1 phosphate-starvation-inducible protein P
MRFSNNFKKAPYLLQALLNVCLFFLAIALSGLLISETWYIVQFVYKSLFNKVDSYYEMLGELLIFFMYFEFIALIIKYFKSDFHFPLRYFIYIGITAVIRLIIIDHDQAISTFWWAMAILAMICAFFIVNRRNSVVEH